MTGARLLADIGGTNARFACATADGAIVDRRSWAVTDHSDFTSALDTYLDETGGAERYGAAAIAAAGPVRQGAIELTNASWRIEAAGVSLQLGGAPTRLLNDVEAVAMALPYLEQSVRWLGEGCVAPAKEDRMIAVNVGTGFGAATIISSNGDWITCPSEAGHMSLGAQNAAELRLLDGPHKRTRTIEEALSGNGLPWIYSMLSLQSDSSVSRPVLSSSVISHQHDDPIAKETLRYVTILLGRVTGDLVLASAAWGGVYFCGSVAREWATVADIGLFRRHFEDKGKMSSRLRQTPSALIANEHPAFIGLAHARIQES